MLKKAVLKEFHLLFKMNDKKRNLILLRILEQIQQDNKNPKYGTEKSIATICNEEGISFEQVFYILFFDIVLIIILQLLE